MSRPEGEPDGLRRRVLWLQGMSVTWTAVYAAAAITAGIAASSIALIGLGLESVIGLFAAAIVIWQLGRDAPARDPQAIRLIGTAFWASGAYLLVESLRELVDHDHSGHSTLDLAVAAAALVVMPVLAWAKRRTGNALASRTLLADAAETAMCAVTAAAALLGVGLDAWFGWWWAVPAAGLTLAAAGAIEGIQLWKGHLAALRPH
jgi:divalent metal cation (Fe/Co/Zn/Cd) transporter